MAKSKNKPNAEFLIGFKKRLAEVVGDASSSNSLADSIGMSRTGFRKWLNEDALPNAWHLRCLCEVADVRIQWLIYGAEPKRASTAKYSMDVVGNEQREFYRREFVYEMALAMNNEIRALNGVITAKEHARVLAALCYLFKSADIEPEAIRMILETSVGKS